MNAEQVATQASMKVYRSMSDCLSDIIAQAFRSNVQNMDPQKIRVKQSSDGNLNFTEVESEA